MAIVVVGLPLSLGLAAGIVPKEKVDRVKLVQEQASLTKNQIKLELTKPCVRWMLAEKDSDLEKKSELEINQIVGGKVSTKETCKWVIN